MSLKDTKTFHHLFSKTASYILFCFLLSVSTNTYSQTNEPALIPLPISVEMGKDSFRLSRSTTLFVTDNYLMELAAWFRDLSLHRFTIRSSGTETASTNLIVFKIDSAKVQQKEGYRLQVDQDRISLLAHDAGGLVYGLQTLRQLWQPGKESTAIPACIISDYPRYAYRGMALDVSRHMFPVSFIKKYIDILSLYKFNTFHWHLTDDQGWRIEIKKYPRLQSVAAWRNETLIGHKKELPHRFDGKKYGGYYSHEEVKDIVAYASLRNITIIPEIEMPGHASAALAAYPAIGCTGGPYKTATFWGVFDDVFCAGNDSTFRFLENVLSEVIDLFPSPFIHIGGDECPKTKWKQCPKCQQRIRNEKLKDEHDLQSYFINRIEKFVNAKGRNIIGWDEILEGGLAPNATVMSWRGEEGGIAAAKQQHPVIMTPESHVYFDYYQSLYTAEPLAAAGFTPLRKTYSYQPASTYTSVQKFIKGLEGQAWSEYFADAAKAEYMIFPRAFALAEIAWTDTKQQNYSNFLVRLRKQRRLFNELPLNVANNFDEIEWTAEITTSRSLNVHLQTSLTGSTIRYTLDGKEPTEKTTVYSGPIEIKKSSILKAALYSGSKKPGRTLSQQFIVHKGVGATTMFKYQPVSNYNPMNGLVNGLQGNSRYNTGQWTGFSGVDLDVTIDLGSVQNIQSIETQFLQYHWQRMWAPVELKIFISQSGSDFKEIHGQTKFPVNGINQVKAIFKKTNARYIRLYGKSIGIIPGGEYGAGGKALMMIDEVIVR